MGVFTPTLKVNCDFTLTFCNFVILSLFYKNKSIRLPLLLTLLEGCEINILKEKGKPFIIGWKNKHYHLSIESHPLILPLVTLLSLSILQKAAAVGGLARAAHLRQRGRAARQGLERAAQAGARARGRLEAQVGAWMRGRPSCGQGRAGTLASALLFAKYVVLTASLVDSLSQHLQCAIVIPFELTPNQIHHPSPELRSRGFLHPQATIMRSRAAHR